MSENLFLGNASPDGYIAQGQTEITPLEDAKTALPVSVSSYYYIKISPVGGQSTRARTVEILKDGTKRWYGDFRVSDNSPMEELIYHVPQEVEAIQIYYKNSPDTVTGLFIVGINIDGQAYQSKAVSASQSAVTKNDRYLGKLELDLDPDSERYAIFDRRTAQPLFHGRTEHYRPIIAPEKYGTTDELLVVMFDDSGEFEPATKDKVKTELFDANAE